MFDRFNAQLLKAGIFYVQNPNAHAELAAKIRLLASAPQTVDIAYAMGGITSKFGHPQGGLTLVVSRFLYPNATRDELDGLAFHSVDSVDDIDSVLDRLVAQGPDFVKIYLHHSEEFSERRARVSKASVRNGLDYSQTENLLGLNPALVAPLVAAAQARQLRVVAHVSTVEDVRIAIAAGVDQLGHLPGAYVLSQDDLRAKRLSDADIANIERSGASVVPTYNARPDLTPPELRDQLADLQRTHLSRLHQANVELFLGADAFDQTAADEYARLVALDVVKPTTLLQMWIDTGRGIFPQRAIGRIKPGYEASFLVFSGDPSAGRNALDAIEQRYMLGEKLQPQPKTR